MTEFEDGDYIVNIYKLKAELFDRLSEDILSKNLGETSIYNYIDAYSRVAEVIKDEFEEVKDF